MTIIPIFSDQKVQMLFDLALIIPLLSLFSMCLIHFTIWEIRRYTRKHKKAIRYYIKHGIFAIRRKLKICKLLTIAAIKNESKHISHRAGELPVANI